MSWVRSRVPLGLKGGREAVAELVVNNLTIPASSHRSECCSVNHWHSVRTHAIRPVGRKLRGVNWRCMSNGVAFPQKFRLTIDTINPNVKNMEYAVRGKMPQEAAMIEEAIKKVN